MARRRGPIAMETVPTGPQMNCLTLLARAYDADVAVAIGPRTRWSGNGATASRMVAHGLVARSLARYSEPGNRHLLLTERGKALAGVQPVDRTKLPV